MPLFRVFFRASCVFLFDFHTTASFPCHGSHCSFILFYSLIARHSRVRAKDFSDLSNSLEQFYWRVLCPTIPFFLRLPSPQIDCNAKQCAKTIKRLREVRKWAAEEGATGCFLRVVLCSPCRLGRSEASFVAEQRLFHWIGLRAVFDCFGLVQICTFVLLGRD